MQKWNQKINLIGQDSDLVVIRQHFLDSLSCLLSDLVRPGVRLLDLGSGAGFPGIPLKITVPDLRLTLVDAVTKKVMFLRHLCRVLNFQDVACVAARMEQFGPAQFDVIVSRAVGALPYLIRLATPFLAPTGHLLLQRGPQGLEELREHDGVWQNTGLHLIPPREVSLSFFTHSRYLIMFRNENKA